jgi:hypothetical protein
MYIHILLVLNVLLNRVLYPRGQSETVILLPYFTTQTASPAGVKI